MSKLNKTIKAQIQTVEELEKISKNIDDTTIYTLSDLYWDSRTQRRNLQKIMSETSKYEDVSTLRYFEEKFLDLEQAFKSSIKVYCEKFEVGRWALAQHGVGPISVVRLLRYVDVTKARTHEKLWAYAGLAPNSGPFQKYNSSLKDTCVDLGRSFIRNAEHSDCFYGQLYTKELDRRTELNEQGAYAELAKQDGIDSDSSGINQKLTQERLKSQAQRYAVKIFLVHWYTLDYKDSYGREYVTSNKNIVPIPGI